MERHRCKLCFRDFANGRALGGHMRSHMMNLSAAQNSLKKDEVEEEEEDQVVSDENFQEYDESSNHSYSSSSTSSEGGGGGGSEKSPSFVLQDGESETESSRNNPFCSRSKRVQKSRVFYSDRFAMKEFSQAKKSRFRDTYEQSPLSSISDTTPDEEVACCLMMLSREKWEKGNVYSEVVKVKTTEDRGKYKCETCSKFFPSYQALGGHRASHKKFKVGKAVLPAGGGPAVVEAAAVQKFHECPFCQRVFASGQALGGHKRSHLIGAAAISANAGGVSPAEQLSRNGEEFDIDLNFPAPDDEDEISH